jgi:hypothetical protein
MVIGHNPLLRRGLFFGRMDNMKNDRLTNFGYAALTVLILLAGAGFASLFPLLWFWVAHGLAGVSEYTSVWVISFLYSLGALLKAIERRKNSR